MKNKTLVLGIGNPILGDDGVGIHAVRKLKEETSEADLEEASVSGLELVELFKGYAKVIIIDAIKTREGKPGDVQVLGIDDIPTLHGLSPHDVDFATAMEYGKRFIGEMPEIEIYGIEAANVTEYTEKLTPEVEASMENVVDEIKIKINDGLA